jgi:DNA-binding CsgD family transcriptional regulator
MIRQNSDLTSLLSAAIGLVNAPRPETYDAVQIGNAKFRLVAEHHVSTGWVVVLMQETDGNGLCDERLKSCYGLTNREIQVARLLAERQSNREIADLLDVTLSTAGRHTERVMQKLGVGSRRHVREKLLS